ncbi:MULTISPECIES: class I SAM-dependent methyltransferase [unclassified Pseudomonas]|uniref:class I SAM-dependent methyltransferase n=1 Tax=unclassified Pseudomonas TaxID=196821 RepID=UPI001CC0D847|nr:MULTISPECIES: class I SAM-dependent methyltransferase [unclassified Pseudomonas]
MTQKNLKATLFHQSAHLSEQDLLAPSVSCPFCSATERKKVAVLQDAPDVALLHCKNCNAASASRMPKPETLSKYYSRYYDTFDDTEDKITLDAPDRMASHIVRCAAPTLGSLSGRDISILDYGGGDGSISARVAQELIGLGAAKVNIALVDYNKSTIATSDNRIQFYRPSDLTDIQEKTMHLVIASAIIEHIPEPREVLAKLLASLKKDGVFYARTPYVTPLSKITKAINIKFDFTYPAHVHDLGAKFWNNVIDVLPLEGEFSVFHSTPSIVETSFKQHFFRTLIAHTLKLPGYVFKEAYGLVGGWEICIRRHS